MPRTKGCYWDYIGTTLLFRNYYTIRSLAVVVVGVASDDAPPPSHVLASPDRRLKPLRLLPPVSVLPALHQHHQGVEPEEDDDGDDDALDRDPDVGPMMAGARDSSVVSQLLDRRRWVLEAEGEGSPHDKVEQNQEGDNLQQTPVNSKYFSCRKIQ